jgi:hypothetical protein
MEPILQPSNSLTTNVECQPAANSAQPEQPFNEVLLKQYAIIGKSTDPKGKTKCQPAANSAQPEKSLKKGLLKQPAIVEKSTDPKEKIAEEAIPLNFLPSFSTQSSQDQCNSPEPVQANLLGQPSDQNQSIIQNQRLPFILSLRGGVGNLEKKTLSSTPGQVKSNPSASESLTVQDLPNILNSKEGLLQAGSLLKGVSIPSSEGNPQDLKDLDPTARTIDLKNIRWRENVSLLDPQLHSSKEGLLQAGSLLKGVSIPTSEGNPQDLKDLDPTARTIDLKNIRWEGNSFLLDHQLDSSAQIIPVRSPFDDRAIQPEGTSPKSELNPTLLNQKEVIPAPTEPRSPMTKKDPEVISNGQHQPVQDSSVTNELPGEQKKPIGVVETGLYQKPLPTQKEHLVYQRMDEKGILNANFLEQKGMAPSSNLDFSMFPGFDEKMDILLGQNSKGEELPGRSLNGEFSGLGNSSAEKNSLKVISGGENHPTQDPFGVNELLGSPKPPIAVEETRFHQTPQPSKTENLDLSQQIAEKLIWSISNNKEEIRLTLDPPQLGNLFIELHRDKEEIKATLWADNPKTKEILENNQFQLQKTLEGHGFKLEKYDVFVQNDMKSFQRNEEKPIFHHGQGSQKQSLQIKETEFPPSLEILPGAIPRAWGSKYIDRFI